MNEIEDRAYERLLESLERSYGLFWGESVNANR